MSERAKVGNNTSIVGLGDDATIDGFGLQIDKASNVIVRNLGIHHCIDTDAISVTYSNNIWIDHNEFWSERSHGFDYYDGLVE
jgi:pectate lyase